MSDKKPQFLKPEVISLVASKKAFEETSTTLQREMLKQDLTLQSLKARLEVVEDTQLRLIESYNKAIKVIEINLNAKAKQIKLMTYYTSAAVTLALALLAWEIFG